MSNQLRRILTALAAAPIFVAVAYVGGWAFAVLLAAVGVLAQRELFQMARTAGIEPLRPVGVALGVALVASPLVPVLLAACAAGTVVFLALAPFLLPQERFLDHLSVTLTGAVYPCGLLGALVALREARGPQVDALDAFWLVLLTVFLVWAADIFAFYAGRAFGRHKLAPTISPGKTWEGAVGGVVGAALVGAAFKLTVLDAVAAVHVAVVVGICSILGPAGDLAESQLKRSTGTKDAGSILPGHGGVFDRFDAMIIAAPLVYLYLRHVAGLFA